MAYEIGPLPLELLIGPAARAGEALVRLDERLARSPLRAGWIERQHFADACAALWVEGELVHVEDLVLHDAHMDIRTPTHELTRAYGVLAARRQIFDHQPAWALSAAGLASLTRRTITPGLSTDHMISAPPAGAAEREPTAQDRLSQDEPSQDEPSQDEPSQDQFSQTLAAIDAVLARSTSVLEGQTKAASDQRAGERNRPELVYDDEWDEGARLAQWHGLIAQTKTLPSVLRAAILTDAWGEIDVLQRAGWLGPLLVAAALRQDGIAAHHLPALHLGTKQIPRERRRARKPVDRLCAVLDAIFATAQSGLKEHDRLLAAKDQMERRVGARRSNSKLPDLMALVLSRPLVSSGMIQEALQVSKQSALNLVRDLGLREMTGRGRFRAWGVI